MEEANYKLFFKKHPADLSASRVAVIAMLFQQISEDYSLYYSKMDSFIQYYTRQLHPLALYNMALFLLITDAWVWLSLREVNLSMSDKSSLTWSL